jgi:hypothetical protein
VIVAVGMRMDVAEQPVPEYGADSRLTGRLSEVLVTD